MNIINCFKILTLEHSAMNVGEENCSANRPQNFVFALVKKEHSRRDSDREVFQSGHANQSANRHVNVATYGMTAGSNNQTYGQPDENVQTEHWNTNC